MSTCKYTKPPPFTITCKAEKGMQKKSKDSTSVENIALNRCSLLSFLKYPTSLRMSNSKCWNYREVICDHRNLLPMYKKL